MLLLLAPSKTMTMEYVLPKGAAVSQAHFLDEANRIVRKISRRTDIASLMRVSDSIASHVTSLYRQWGSKEAPAIYAYKGDVYRWFFAETLSREDLKWAQERVYILSGLYGALRPLDLVSPYRLEMKTKIQIDSDNDLYAFWGDAIARYIDAQGSALICNLSSDEYAKVVTKYTKKRVITPMFLDNKTNGTIGTVPIYSKMMRGVMARWVIDNRIETPEGLADFSLQGYRFDKEKSTKNAPAFYRDVPKPIRF